MGGWLWFVGQAGLPFEVAGRELVSEIATIRDAGEFISQLDSQCWR